ncbi:DNA damage-binding protein 1a-like isoform X2 [Manihot esculenta]|uniref:DNA damage-binding protein 1a-like isoform X2 n=1 Tax=Manihot esculenta TaxID=3983 RepID=UPI000B5D4B66|nr:DNA damage-binding protein 1a-like isoform X2 [Manihot esculenta]
MFLVIFSLAITTKLIAQILLSLSLSISSFLWIGIIDPDYRLIGLQLYDGLFKVTSSYVRLVSSTTRQFSTEWNAASSYSINVATANTTQIYFLLKSFYFDNFFKGI